MTAEIFEDVFDLFYRLRDHDRDLVKEAVQTSREFGGPCTISPDGIMIHTKSYFGEVFYALVTDVNSDNIEYAAREIFDAMRNLERRPLKPVRKTA